MPAAAASRRPPLRIGLTGGIASGKSTVARLFAERGVTVIDTDVIAREVVEPGEPALEEIVAAFGPAILGPDGRLDRAQLRARVFADAAQRRTLERIVHPRIRARTLQAAEAAPGPYLVLVVPLLVETDFAALVDRVLVVDCPEADQLRRLRQRDGTTGAEAQRMLDAQISRRVRLDAADDVIDNAGHLEQTAAQVAALDRKYRALADRPA